MTGATIARIIAATQGSALRAVSAEDGRLVLHGPDPVPAVTVIVDRDTPTTVLGRVIVPLVPLLAPRPYREEELCLALLISGTLPGGRCILGRLDDELVLQADVATGPERFPAAVVAQARFLQRQALHLAPAFALVGRGISARAALNSLDEQLETTAVLAAAQRILATTEHQHD